ncbi:MAG: methionine--tRNA ligase subunit beta [Candidatus Brocadiia bacterium]
MISFQDFQEMELKVGRVISVEDHPDADKLLILRVDLGEDDPRTLVAGLKGHYSAEELEGKLIVVVSNLEPARLRGVESNGMLLAAQEDEKVVLLTLDEPIKPGSEVL